MSQKWFHRATKQEILSKLVRLSAFVPLLILEVLFAEWVVTGADGRRWIQAGSQHVFRLLKPTEMLLNAP